MTEEILTEGDEVVEPTSDATADVTTQANSTAVETTDTAATADETAVVDTTDSAVEPAAQADETVEAVAAPSEETVAAPGPAAAPAPTATAAGPAVVSAPAATADSTDEAPSLLKHLRTINTNLTEVPANIQNIAAMLDGYIKAMAPGTPVNAREGVNQQKLLKHVLEQAITAPNFQLAIEAVLFYFNQHAGRTFSDRHLGRFVHEMQLTTQQANTFNTLRVVFQTMAEPTGRAARIKLALDVAKIAKTIDQKLVRNLLAFMDSAK